MRSEAESRARKASHKPVVDYKLLKADKTFNESRHYQKYIFIMKINQNITRNFSEQLNM